MPFSNDIDHHPLIRIDGIDGTVHTVDADAGLVFCIVGMCAQSGIAGKAGRHCPNPTDGSCANSY